MKHRSYFAMVFPVGETKSLFVSKRCHESERFALESDAEAWLADALEFHRARGADVKGWTYASDLEPTTETGNEPTYCDQF